MSAHLARLLAPLSIMLCCHPALGAMPRAAPAADPDPSQLCRAAIAATERNTRIPDAFLSAIGRVESGRPAAGALSPWPWTVNAAGTGHFYATKTAAVDAVRQFHAAGISSIDVGCLQVNLFYHPDAFASLDQAFDPAINAAYAAKLLLELFATTGSWPRAAAAYHSMTPALGLAYQQKVLAQWAMPDRAGTAEPRRAARSRSNAQAALAANDAGPVLTQQPDMPVHTGPAGAASPTLGFTRRFMLPAAKLAAGRSLAAYRAMPVRIAWRK